ncbi:hypothetical protein BC937DRAFT_88241, partial [Endogone sp. FLAS-F59071]
MHAQKGLPNNPAIDQSSLVFINSILGVQAYEFEYHHGEAMVKYHMLDWERTRLKQFLGIYPLTTHC